MENDNSDGLVRLMGGISLNELISQGGTTFEVNFEDAPEPEQTSYDPQDVYNYVTSPCLDLVDEPSYADGACEPFSTLQERMTKITEDSKVYKQIIREGHGTQILPQTRVTVHYNAFLEYNDEPFDSTYIRKKPFNFCLGDGSTIPGLDLGVQTMRVNEKARFLVHHEYAYGKFGCLDRVPPESTVLFEVEVINCHENQASGGEDNLSKIEQKEFTETYSYCFMLCTKGNSFFKKSMFKLAIREYNTAATKLESCILKDFEEQEKQQLLLLRILTNLVVAYTKIEQPKRACSSANKIINMCKGTSLKVPTKVFFNKAKSLVLLGDYVLAERLLEQARRLEPQNLEITREFIKLDEMKKKSYNQEKEIAKKMFKSSETEQKAGVMALEADFQKAIKDSCKALVQNKDAQQCKVPQNLTDRELEFTKEEAQRHGLDFTFSKDKQEYYIVKVN